MCQCVTGYPTLRISSFNSCCLRLVKTKKRGCCRPTFSDLSVADSSRQEKKQPHCSSRWPSSGRTSSVQHVADVIFKKWHRWVLVLTRAVVSYSSDRGAKRPQLSELTQTKKKKKIWFKQMFSRFPSLLWLFVKQHNGGFVPAIWSTVKLQLTSRCYANHKPAKWITLSVEGLWTFIVQGFSWQYFVK